MQSFLRLSCANLTRNNEQLKHTTKTAQSCLITSNEVSVMASLVTSIEAELTGIKALWLEHESNDMMS